MASLSSRALVALKPGVAMVIHTTRIRTFPNLLVERREKRNYSIKSSSLDPPDVGRLAETSRISLTSQEVEEFGPKMQQVVEWFGQLQAVDLESVEPAIRSGASHKASSLSGGAGRGFRTHMYSASSLRNREISTVTICAKISLEHLRIGKPL